MKKNKDESALPAEPAVRQRIESEASLEIGEALSKILGQAIEKIQIAPKGNLAPPAPPPLRPPELLLTFLRTGELPETIFVLEAAAILAEFLPSLDQMGIGLILAKHITLDEIDCWALGEDGGWVKGRKLFQLFPVGPVHIKFPTSSEVGELEGDIQDKRMLLTSRMGVSLKDAALLLQKKNQVLPLELVTLLGLAEPNAESAQEPRRERGLQIRQEEEILQKLKMLGHDPLSLPRNENGKPGVRAEVRKALGKKGMWVSDKVFSHAWDRLINKGLIAFRD